jgi:hypothetical protein
MGTKLCVRIGSDQSSTQTPTAVEQFLCAAVEDSLSPHEIVDAIGMPQGTVVNYEFSNDDRLVDGSGVVRVKLTVRASEDAAELLSSNVEADVGDLILGRLDGLAIAKLHEYSDEVDPSRPAELRFEVSDSLPKSTSSADLAAKAGFEPGTVLGWSKGCNSWPW